MKKERGFTIIELLVVVAILGLIAAIAIPNLRRARLHANQASAIQSMRTIVTAQYLYERKYQVYGTLAGLNPEGTLDPQLASGSKSSYTFAITLSPDAKSFSATATPQSDQTILNHFFVDVSAVIRFNYGAPADVNSQPIPE